MTDSTKSVDAFIKRVTSLLRDNRLRTADDVAALVPECLRLLESSDIGTRTGPGLDLNPDSELWDIVPTVDSARRLSYERAAAVMRQIAAERAHNNFATPNETATIETTHPSESSQSTTADVQATKRTTRHRYAECCDFALSVSRKPRTVDSIRSIDRRLERLVSLTATEALRRETGLRSMEQSVATKRDELARREREITEEYARLERELGAALELSGDHGHRVDRENEVQSEADKVGTLSRFRRETLANIDRLERHAEELSRMLASTAKTSALAVTQATVEMENHFANDQLERVRIANERDERVLANIKALRDKRERLFALVMSAKRIEEIRAKVRNIVAKMISQLVDETEKLRIDNDLREDLNANERQFTENSIRLLARGKTGNSILSESAEKYIRSITPPAVVSREDISDLHVAYCRVQCERLARNIGDLVDDGLAPHQRSKIPILENSNKHPLAMANETRDRFVAFLYYYGTMPMVHTIRRIVRDNFSDSDAFLRRTNALGATEEENATVNAHERSVRLFHATNWLPLKLYCPPSVLHAILDVFEMRFLLQTDHNAILSKIGTLPKVVGTRK